MKALKITMFALVVLAVCLLMVASADAQGPARGSRLTGWRRPAYVVASGASWAWGSMYYDARTIYSGARAGYYASVGAASTFLTPRYAR